MSNIKFKLALALTYIISFFINPLIAQRFTITGKVIDSKTSLPMESVNVYLKKGQVGKITDKNGNFVINTGFLPDTLIVSHIGYQSFVFFIPEKYDENILVKLEENTAILDEIEVVFYIDPGKHIIKEVISHKQKNDVQRFNNSIYNQYRKTELDVYNISPRSSGFFNNIVTKYNKFNNDSTGRSVPLYFIERFSTIYHSNKLQTNIEHNIANTQLGLSTDKLAYKFEKFEFKINIYDGIIPIFKIPFVSPISTLGLSFYKYIPLDTVFTANRQYIKLGIIPKVKNENTFTGYIWIEDETFAITKFDLTTSKDVGINFIDNLTINEEFIQIKNKTDSTTDIWVPKNYTTSIKFSNGLDLIGIPVKGDSSKRKVKLYSSYTFSNYIINAENITSNNFYYISHSDSTSIKSRPINEFNDAYRLQKLSAREQSIYSMVDSLKTNKKFITGSKIMTLLATGYWDFGCKLRIGPYSSLFSTNMVEGLRTRMSFWTLPCIYKNINFNGFVAYGIRDKVVKGGLGIKYVPTTTRYLKTEFFIRSDYDALMDFDDELDRDNVFTLAMRKNIPAYQVFIQQSKILQEIDVNNNWSTKIFFNMKTLDPTFNYSYYKFEDDSIIDFTPFKKIAINELGISFRYAHNERTTILNYDKIRISTLYPIFTFHYIYGFEISNKNYFVYHKLVAQLTHELSLPSKGSIFYSASVGQLIGIVPALLLFSPQGNAYYVTNKYTFNNMLPYEFAADRYASLMIRYNMGGLIFDHIPILNKLKLRERIIFNNYWGALNKKNKTYNSMNSVKTTGTIPYSEAGAGIGNIFNVLSIDAIWRLTHFESKQSYTQFGIYTTLTLVF